MRSALCVHGMILKCSHYRLAKADPAVVCGDQVVGPDRDLSAVQQIFQVAQQKLVLKDSA
jgi:hypothetical protein